VAADPILPVHRQVIEPKEDEYSSVIADKGIHKEGLEA
jgi:hypothetical protein